MLSTTNLTIQFEAKPLFEHVSVKFSDGNRYGLIGANGSGKSTLMKILGGELEQSAGDVVLQTGMRMGKLNQNQFAYEDERVLDVVMQGHAEMWAAMRERDLIYANAEATDDDYMRAAELEGKVAEYDGYTAEARAGAILIDAGIDESKHNLPMREIPPGLKLRVLLAQALFSRPDVLLLDEPTNNLDIHSIGWLERTINAYDATMIIISHDRHFLNQVCTHIADLDYQQLKIYPGNYDDFMLASVQARQRVEASNAKAKAQISDLQEFVRRFSANASKARQATSRKRQLEKIKIEEIRPSSRQNPYIRFEQAKKLYRSAVTVDGLTFRYPGADQDIFTNLKFTIEAEQRVAIIGPNGIGKTTLMRCLAGDLTPTAGTITWVENAQVGYMPQDPSAEFEQKSGPAHLDVDVDGQGRRRADRARHARPPAVLGRRDQEAGEGALGRREGPHDVRQADADAAERDADGRADQPHGHGNDRVAADRAGEVPGHAGLRLARPRIRGRAGQPHDRAEARRQRHRLHRHLRRVPRGAGPRIVGPGRRPAGTPPGPMRSQQWRPHWRARMMCYAYYMHGTSS